MDKEFYKQKYGKNWHYYWELSQGIDPDNERLCRRCKGSGCNSCDGCGEVGGRNRHRNMEW